MRKKNKLVCGVGINDFDEAVIVNGQHIPVYICWHGMLRRCYYQSYQTKYPTYIGCTVCEEWKSFSNFKQWYDLHYREGTQLDKDILVEGNKIYSPATCRFVPSNINSLLIDCGSARGEFPLGINPQKPSIKTTRVTTTYRAECRNGQGKQLNKTFKTLDEAVQWYSETKTRIVREVAQKALDAGEIQQDIFDALVARKF